METLPAWRFVIIKIFFNPKKKEQINVHQRLDILVHCESVCVSTADDNDVQDTESTMH